MTPLRQIVKSLQEITKIGNKHPSAYKFVFGEEPPEAIMKHNLSAEELAIMGEEYDKEGHSSCCAGPVQHQFKEEGRCMSCGEPCGIEHYG